MTSSRDQMPEEIKVKTENSSESSGHVYIRRPYTNEGLGADCYPAEDAPVVLDPQAPINEIRYGSSRNDEGIRSLFKQIKDLLRIRRARLRALRRECAQLRKELAAKYARQSLANQRVRYSHVEGYVLLPAEALSVKNTRALDWRDISIAYLRPIRAWLSKYANAWLRCGKWDLSIYTRDIERLFSERALFHGEKGLDLSSPGMTLAAFQQRWVAATPASLQNLLQKCTGPKGQPPETWWCDQGNFGVVLRRDSRVRKLTAKETLKYQRQTKRYSRYLAALKAADVYRTKSEAVVSKLKAGVDSCYEKLHELITFHQLHHIRRWPLSATAVAVKTDVGTKLAHVQTDDWALQRSLIATHSGVVGLSAYSRYRDSDGDHTYALSYTGRTSGQDMMPPLTHDIPLSSHEGDWGYIYPDLSDGSSAIQRIDLTPEWWQDSLDSTIARAALKLQNLRVGPADDQFNLGRSVAELKDTPLLWKQAQEMLALSQLSVASYVARMRGSRVNAGYYENLLRSANISHLGQAPLRVAAALYLAYKFGVEPTLADINTLTRSTREWVRAVRRGLVGMYRVCREATKAATMRAFIADASVMNNGDVDLSLPNGGSVDLTVSLPVASGGYRETDGLWHPGRHESTRLFCPRILETNLYGEWTACPNLMWCLSHSESFEPQERAGWVAALFNDYVERRIRSLYQLRYRWYLARGSKVFARITAAEINKILKIEAQRNFLATGLQFKVAWELVPLSFLVDWFTNTAKIATAITDAWQSVSDEVNYTDDGLWAVIRSERYASIVAPETLRLRSLSLMASGPTFSVRYRLDDGSYRYIGSDVTYLGAEGPDIIALRNGLVTGEQMEYSQWHDPGNAFDWAFQPRDNFTNLRFHRLGVARATITATYPTFAKMQATLVERSTTRLPIEVQAWRALLPRLEFHMTGGKLSSLLALLIQGTRWVH